MENKLEQYPGCLGWTTQGVIAIHADWPTYPIEHGLTAALLAFGSYPQKTKFIQIDDLDNCRLFIAGEYPSDNKLVDKPNKEFDLTFQHVAAWTADLYLLCKNKYIQDFTLISHYDAALLDWEKSKNYYTEIDNEYLPLNMAKPDPDDYSCESTFPIFNKNGFQLTNAGFKALENFLSSNFYNIDESILNRVVPLLQIRYFDTAVREACIIVESSIKKKLESKKWGEGLINEYFDFLISNNNISAKAKILRAELRAMFKYIRNEYMHNLHAIEELECKALIVRVSRLYQVIISS